MGRSLPRRRARPGWSTGPRHRTVSRTGRRHPVVRKIVHLRWKQRLGPVEIGDRLDMPASTVHAVLVRCRINRLTHIDRATGEPIRRYEHEQPGDLIHVDVKKLGRVPDGGGWRYVGRQQGEEEPRRDSGAHRSPQQVPPPADRDLLPAHRHRRPLPRRLRRGPRRRDQGDRDRGPAQRGRLVRRPRRHRPAGPQRQRQLLQVPPVARHLRRPGHHPEEDPALPAPDQREDRTLPPDPGRGLGIQEVLQLRVSPTRRSASMGPRVQPPPAPLSHRQGRTHHQVGQPGWASQ